MNLKNIILAINVLFIFIIFLFLIPNYKLDDLGATCFIVYPLLNIGIALFKKDWKILQFLLVISNLGIFIYSIFTSFVFFLIGYAFFGDPSTKTIFFILFILFSTLLNLIYSINIFNKTPNTLKKIQNKIILQINNKINHISKNNLGKWPIKIGITLFIAFIILIFLEKTIHGSSIYYLMGFTSLVNFLYFLFLPLSFLLVILNIFIHKEWRPMFFLVALYVLILLIGVFSGYFVWS